MRYKNYLKSKIMHILIMVLICLIMLLLSYTYTKNISVILLIFFTNMTVLLCAYFLNYTSLKKCKKEYDGLLKETEQPEFITFMKKTPTNYESQVVYSIVREVSNSLYLKYKKKADKINELEDYVNLWVHEVKLPVQNIKNQINGLKIEEEIDYELEKVNELINKILYITKLENTKIIVNLKRIKSKELINDIIKQNFTKIIFNNIKVHIEVQDINLHVDKQWLEIIINQIIDNSIKYKAKEITIKGDVISNYYVIEIIDDGVGIQQEEIPYVFEKSYTSQRTKEIISSTGMGLYMVKKIVDILKYKVDIASNVNEGTRVIIKIPIKASEIK